MKRYFSVVYTRARNCLGVVARSMVTKDKDLDIPVCVPMPLVLFNPKTAPVSRQIDLLFTFESTASDFLMRDDGVHAYYGYSDPNNISLPNGDTTLFSVSSYDELIDTLQKLLPDPKYFNNRHIVNLGKRKATFNKFVFTNIDLSVQIDPWTRLNTELCGNPAGISNPDFKLEDLKTIFAEGSGA